VAASSFSRVSLAADTVPSFAGSGSGFVRRFGPAGPAALVARGRPDLAVASGRVRAGNGGVADRCRRGRALEIN